MWKMKGFCFWGSIVILSSFVRGRTLIQEPQLKPVYIKAGSQLHLRCEQLSNYKIQWSRLSHSAPRSGNSAASDYRVLTPENGFNQTSFEEDGRKVNVLEKKVVTFNDSGSYRCEVTSGLESAHNVDVYVVNTQGIDGVLTKVGGDAVLQCRFLSEEPVSVKFLWFRDGRELTSQTTKYRSNSTSGSEWISFLHISKLGELDVGEYLCHVTIGNGLNFTQVVNLYSSPHVRPFERSRMAVEGSDLFLECNAWGRPSPKIAWFRGNSSLSSPNGGGGDERIEFFNSSFLVNSGLVVKGLTYADRGTYTCVATSAINGTSFSGSAGVFVRIKGRLAALYPLIGIFVEIVILLIIILIYERRRRKQRMKELSESTDDLIVLFDKVLDDQISLRN